MDISVITIFPDFVRQTCSVGVTGRAFEKSIARLRCINPREFSGDERGTVDDRPFGGGPGMVMKVEPLKAALASLPQSSSRRVVFLSPQGRTLRQPDLIRFSRLSDLVLICGRYEGVDQRFIDTYVDEEVSLGDFVLSGGELAASVVVDGLVRLLPGALGKQASANEDSFMAGLLDHPHFTRPERQVEGDVPEVLLCGDHGKVSRWRRQQALGATWLKRPDLLARMALTEDDRGLLARFIEKYVREGKKVDANSLNNDIMAGL